MKTLRTLLVIAIAIVLFGEKSFAQDPLKNVATQTATANVIQALTVESKVPLSFGTFSGKNDVATNVIIPITGVRTGSANLIATAPGVAGTFDIIGQPNNPLTITMGYGSSKLTSDNTKGADMALTDWKTSQDGHLTSLTLPEGGKITLTVGATLNVGINQAADTYSGTYSVTVNYN